MVTVKVSTAAITLALSRNPDDVATPAIDLRPISAAARYQVPDIANSSSGNAVTVSVLDLSVVATNTSVVDNKPKVDQKQTVKKPKVSGVDNKPKVDKKQTVKKPKVKSKARIFDGLSRCLSRG